MKQLRFLAFAVLVSALGACQSGPPPKDFSALRQEAPRSILVIPVVNKTTQADAPNIFLSTLTVPLAERGYYVFPVNMVKHVMEDDGLSDADMVAGSDVTRLAGLFGADAVLFATIEHWDSKYIVISTTTQVDIHYVLKSGKTGATLWEDTIHESYTPQNNAGGDIFMVLAVDAITAAVQRAHPDYLPLANQANVLAFTDPNQGLLVGPYGKTN